MQLSLSFQNINVILQLLSEYNSEVLIMFNKKHIVYLIINNKVLVRTTFDYVVQMF